MTIDVGADTAHALLTDGTIALVRPARPEDESRVREMHEAMSPENRRMRFFVSGTPDAGQLARRICARPDRGHQALLAIVDDELIGAAAYDVTDRPDVAEVALAVADRFHGRGVGTLLLEHLASRARHSGVTAFRADVLPANREMLRVFSDIGLRPHQRFDRDVVELTIPLDPDDRYLDAIGERESRAGRESLHPLLRPRSVVVVGGTRRPVSVGNAILRNIRTSGFTGRLYAVHPQAATVADVAAVPSMADLPEAPDLAVISVPPGAVVDVARECGQRGVGAVVVITADLEADADRELFEVCRRHGMRLVGPNCFGVASLDDDVRLQATFSAHPPLPGHAGMVVQSGGIGITLLEHLSRLGIGVSSFVSTGNKLDVSSNDLLRWWEADPNTTMAIMHVESFGNPRKFSRVARRLGRKMPVLTVLAGRSAAGQRAAASHTGASLTPALTTETLFRQAGVLAARGIGELIGTAAFLAHQPLPSGPRVAIVTNAGGTGVLAADACADAGLEVRELGEQTRRDIEALLPAEAASANPIDTTPAARSDQLRACLGRLAEAPEVDAIVAIMVRTALADPLPVVATANWGKPVVAVAPDQAETVTNLPSGEHGVVPSYSGPEAAAAALGHAWERARWLARPAGEAPVLTAVSTDRAQRIARGFLKQRPEGGWLPL
ncbi:bifunctional acetate--CoA ligase family protein/GNAT family N-acetyltransferase, partial [Thermobifida halotolerans]